MRKHDLPRINRIIEELEVALEASSRGKLKLSNRLRLKEIAMLLSVILKVANGVLGK